MNREQLLAQRAAALAKAAGFKNADGTFADDEARRSFDAAMAEVDGVDVKLRALDATPAPVTAPAATPAVNADAIRSEERGRISAITDVVRLAGLDAGVSADMVGRGITLDAARAEIFAMLAAKDKANPTSNQVRVGEDASDKFSRGVTAWLAIKGGATALVARAINPKQPDTVSFDPGEFRGMTLVEIARRSLELAGIRPEFDKMRMVAQAFTRATQSTSDFPNILENVMHKILLGSYATQPDTWSAWCGRSTVPDFRASNRYRMGSFGALDAINENGEFKNKSIPDAEKASITATTKGNMVNVSRQMIVNDDMGAFTSLLTMLGRAAGLSIESDAYTMLALNSGLGPTQANAQPLFHSSRANVGTGAALSAASLDADSAIMAAQTDPSGKEVLNLVPTVLLLARTLRGQANVINESQFDPDTLANKSQMKPNVARGFFTIVVGTARLTGTGRYMFADPSQYPVFEVAFLEGQESPVLETQNGWRTDGAEMKVRFDYGVAAVDFRGAVYNAGQ
jgi:phage major head subunit gpT-like protein